MIILPKFHGSKKASNYLKQLYTNMRFSPVLTCAPIIQASKALQKCNNNNNNNHLYKNKEQAT